MIWHASPLYSANCQGDGLRNDPNNFRFGKSLSRDVLLRDVWGYSGKVYTRTVDMRIANLRQQLEDDPKQPKFILTVQGLGYKFRQEESEA